MSEKNNITLLILKVAVLEFGFFLFYNIMKYILHNDFFVLKFL